MLTVWIGKTPHHSRWWTESPGSIILMHNGAKNTPEALPQIIDAVRAQGYEFVPFSEIILEGDYTTDHEDRMHLSE